MRPFSFNQWSIRCIIFNVWMKISILIMADDPIQTALL